MKTAHPLATVSPLYFFEVLKIAEEMGLSRQIVEKQLAMDFSKRLNPKTRYSLELFDSLLNIASRELSNPHIGISVGEKFRIATYTDLGNILAFCKDMEEAAYINKRYSSLVHTLGVPHLKTENFGNGPKDTFHWVPNFLKSDYQKFYKVTEYVISNYLMSLNWLAWGFGRGVVEVHYAHAPAEPVKVYDDLLGCKNRFEMDCYRLIMADNIMNKPLPTANAHQLNILKAKQDAILNTYLGMNDRTLKRHLKDQSTTYRKIVERVKRRLCDDLLVHGTPLSEIAQTLWYSDQAAFTHAYKKWYGVPPSRRVQK